jgi:hypothetical protein
MLALPGRAGCDARAGALSRLLAVCRAPGGLCCTHIE